jgi:O-antigen/teichoic acid export membrane protein
MLAVSFWAALSTVTGAVLAQTPPMLIASLMNTEAVARFAIPALLVAQLRQLIHAVAAPMFPAASQLDVSGSEVALQSVYTRGSRIGLLVGLSAAIPLMLLGESFIGYWVGPDFAWTWKILAVLLLGTVAECAQTPGQYIIVATRDISGLSYIQVARTIVTLGLMVAFLKWTDWGLLGVALAMTLTDVVRCCFFLPLYTCRELHLSFRAYLWRVVPGAAALAASLACATGLLRMAWHPGGLAVSMVQLAATGLLGLAGGFFLLIDKADRQRAYGFLARFRPGPRAAP